MIATELCGVSLMEGRVGETSQLGLYIRNLCNTCNLSLREASMRAGLAPDTISQILRRDDTTTPRPDTVRSLADALGGDFMHMTRLAGHLPGGAELAADDVPRTLLAAVRLLTPKEQQVVRFCRVRKRRHGAKRAV